MISAVQSIYSLSKLELNKMTYHINCFKLVSWFELAVGSNCPLRIFLFVFCIPIEFHTLWQEILWVCDEMLYPNRGHSWGAGSTSVGGQRRCHLIVLALKEHAYQIRIMCLWLVPLFPAPQRSVDQKPFTNKGFQGSRHAESLMDGSRTVCPRSFDPATEKEVWFYFIHSP